MITAVSNQRMKNLHGILQKAKVRREQEVFAVEGVKMFLEAPEERVREVYVSESFYEKCTCKEKLERCGYELVSDEVMKRVSDTQTPQGILCVLEQFHYTKKELLQKKAPLLMLLEDIQDPGNLGTILRTAEGAGVDGIILSKGCVDIYNPKTIRSTMGSVYRMPFLYTEELTETMKQLQQEGIRLYAAHLKGALEYDEPDYRTGTAFLIGNEGNGLKEATAAGADQYLKIPMEGQVESLNAAVASAVLMYEAYRQRRRVKNS